MANKYFGAVTSESDTTLEAAYAGSDHWNNGYVTGSGSLTFTCPGTGSQDVKALAYYELGVSVSGGHIKVAVYTGDATVANRTLCASGTITTDGNAGWQITTSITQVATLTGGVAYTLEANCDADIYWVAMSVAAGVANQFASTYASFPPASLTAGNFDLMPALYAGVDTASGGVSTGIGVFSSSSVSLSGSGVLIAYPAWGYSTPDAGEIAQSWATWHLGAGAVVQGNADYGDLVIPPTVTCSSPVTDMGDANSKQITLSSKYGTNLGTYTRYIRGSDTLFAWDAGSPSWTLYTGVVTQAWRYVQVLFTGG